LPHSTLNQQARINPGLLIMAFAHLSASCGVAPLRNRLTKVAPKQSPAPVGSTTSGSLAISQRGPMEGTSTQAQISAFLAAQHA
jgi:hypothetical protein